MTQMPIDRLLSDALDAFSTSTLKLFAPKERLSPIWLTAFIVLGAGIHFVRTRNVKLAEALRYLFPWSYYITRSTFNDGRVARAVASPSPRQIRIWRFPPSGSSTGMSCSH